MNERETRAVISLHDVMPETLPQAEAILGRLRKLNIPPITLLVVPGRDWQPDQLDWLRQRVAEGHRLAAHGWRHETQPRKLYHRLHAALISRNVAEHLALEPADIPGFIRRSMEWFPKNKLPVPILYVPPAWALGKWRTRDEELPAYIEVLSGILDTRTGQVHRQPLVGYEVDTVWRKLFVRGWNSWNIRRARKTGRALRIGLHPHDFELLLADDLEQLLRSPSLTPVDLETSLTA